MRNPLSPDGCRKAVIGIGNPMRGEDAFGVLVAQRVHRFEAMVVQPCSLIEALEDLDAVVIVDAASGRPHGKVEAWEVDEALRLVHLDSSSSRILGLADALRLAQILRRLPPYVRLVTLGIEDSGMGLSMSPTAMLAVDSAAEQAQNLLEEVD